MSLSVRALLAAGAAAALPALLPRTALACAGCSNPNLPVARTDAGETRSAPLRLGVYVTATRTDSLHDEACPEIGPICQVRDEPPQLHDQTFASSELRFVGSYAFTPSFALEAHVPVRLTRTDITFRRLDGTAFEPDYQHIHHRDETLYGLGDPWLLSRWTGGVGPLSFTLRAGLGFPVGETVEDPFALTERGLRHQHVQFGTGLFHPVLSADAALPVGPSRVAVFAQSVLFLYRNEAGHEPGDRHAVGLSADREVLPGLRVGLGADVLHERPERWGGEIQQDGNLGRTDLIAGPTVAWQVGDHALSASAKVPLWQKIAETGHEGERSQLSFPLILSLGWSVGFGG